MEKETVRDYELEIIVKAWRDENFRKRLLKSPKSAIEEEFGIHIHEDVNIFVHEENENNLHLIVPAVPSNFEFKDMSDDDLKTVIGGVMATGHLAAFPNSRERSRIRKLQKENDQQKKMIAKLQKDLSDIEMQLYKKSQEDGQ